MKDFYIVLVVFLFWASLPISAQKEIKVSYPPKVSVGDIFNVSYFLGNYSAVGADESSNLK